MDKKTGADPEQPGLPELHLARNNPKLDALCWRRGTRHQQREISLAQSSMMAEKKTFQGDSGGPLTVEHGGVHILAGIASFGPKKNPVPPSRVPLQQVQSNKPNTFSFSAVSCCIYPSRRSYFIFGISHKVRMCSLACLTFFLGSTPLSCPMGASTLATSPSLLRRIVVQTHAVSLSFV